MKKYLNLILLITLFVLIASNSYIFGHSERVHQYIALEGYKTMKLYLGADIPNLLSHLGYNETNGYVNWYSRGSDNFESGKIVCGAFREDVRDIVWGYGNSIVPGIDEGLQYALASVTHFWNADLGDDCLTNFYHNPLVPYSDIPNAYQKMVIYNSDMWILYPGSFIASAPNGEELRLIGLDGLAVSFYYDDLIEFYKTGLIFAPIVIGKNTSTGVENTYVNSQFYVNEDLRGRIAFDILGRMAHLIADMSVPAHVHNNAHDDASEETYEKQFMHIDTDDDPYSNPNVNYWDAQRVWDEFGSIMDPYVANDDPLHHLMYTVNQFADHFACYLYNGDDNYVNNNSELNTYFPTGIAPTSSITYNNPYPPYTKNILHKNIRDATFPQAIRATAGLLYWFAIETGLYTPPTTSGTLTQNENWIGNVTLTGNVFVPSGVTLTLKSSANINMNSNYIKSTGGVIIIEVNVGGDFVEVKTGSTTKALYSTIKLAINNANSGQTVSSFGEQILSNDDVLVQSGVTLRIKSGSNLDINNFFIKSTGGSIVQESGATITGLKAYLKSGSALKGFFPSLSSAISNASSGQIVDLISTTYNVNLYMKTGVNVSGDGPTNTTINGKVTFTNVSNSKLKNVKVTKEIRDNYGSYCPGSA